jgi:hypothetical protein
MTMNTLIEPVISGLLTCSIPPAGCHMRAKLKAASFQQAAVDNFIMGVGGLRYVL